jgi:AcrR family transcriptional regulator
MPHLPELPRHEAHKLLDAAVDMLLSEGLGDTSMRAIAARIGTSHRMLNYHFGGADGFWDAVLAAARQRQQEAFKRMVDLGAAPDLPSFWMNYSAPGQLPMGRLMFEVFGRTLSATSSAKGLMEPMFVSWLEVLSPLLMQRFSCDEPEARALARLQVAVLRGLLMDLLATGDAAGAQQAIQMFDSMQAGHFAKPAPQRRSTT